MACVPVGKVCALHEFGKTGQIRCAFVGQFFGQRHGLSVVVEGHQHVHVALGATDAHLNAIGHTVEQVGHVVLA
jgi:hypothetical protein